MAQPYPISREGREEAIFLGSGVATYGPFALKIFDVEDVEVWTLAAGEVIWVRQSPLVVKTDAAALSTFSITFASAVPVTTKIKVVSSRVHERSAGVRKGTQIDPDALEKELTKQGTILQELRRDANRSVKADFGEARLTIASGIADGRTLVKSGLFLIEGPDILEEVETARKWAENPEDVAVIDPGGFSALHYAAKAAAAQATTAALTAQAAEHAANAALSAAMLNAAVYDFSMDSDPATPGYDWSM